MGDISRGLTEKKSEIEEKYNLYGAGARCEFIMEIIADKLRLI